jgi:hypothetical protein
MRLAAGAAVVGTSVAAASAADAEKPKVNSEKPVPSKAVPESYGPREMFAVVDGQGKLQRGFHAISAKRLDVGMYEVIFNRDVRRGVYLATVGGHSWGGLPASATIGVMGRATDPRGVLVVISGGSIDSSFHLLVVCPDGYA